MAITFETEALDFRKPANSKLRHLHKYEAIKLNSVQMSMDDTVTSDSVERALLSVLERRADVSPRRD